LLKHLHIQNYAIIDDLQLDFYEGMTVLTGETGAGKSIIVDAISLLLGDRASKEMISSKSKTATVTGVFSLSEDSLKKVLKFNNIDYEDLIVIERTISIENRNIVKINKQMSSIKVLKELAIHLADIHSQFDTNRLINPDNYLSLVDNFRKEKTTNYLRSYNVAFEEYKASLNNYKVLMKEKESTLKQLDLYSYQLKELVELDLKLNEETELTEQINLLENIDKINTVLERFNALVTETRVSENIYELKNDIESIQDTSQDFNLLSKRLNDVYFEFDDIHQTLRDKLNSLDYNQNDFDNMINRLNDIDKFKRKYQKSTEELNEYKAFLEKQVDKVENFDDLINDLHDDLLDKFANLNLETNKLSSFRKDVAKKITKEIIETLHDLVIKNAKFEIRFFDLIPNDEFDLSVFTEQGTNRIDFYITTNKGEPLKQLSKTASGGEMSRVMLAFKAIFVRSNQISTIIFDEIDTGISGFIAKQIANKIREISEICQVISITHIPQVVATGTHHICVRKKSLKDSTETKVMYLDYNERVEEIAKMISAGKVTQASIESAKELLISD